jgi:hypothetical protein
MKSSENESELLNDDERVGEDKVDLGDRDDDLLNSQDMDIFAKEDEAEFHES